jgi:hypothetical protein
MNRYKPTFIIIAVLFALISCSKNDDNGNSNNDETNIDLITGIELKDSNGQEIMILGNPNIFNKKKFNVYPNPAMNIIIIRTSPPTDSISEVWIRSAQANKVYQNTDFQSILNSSTYSESQIESNSVLQTLDVNLFSVLLNLDSLNKGYHKIFVKINGNIYWDNIYKADDFSEVEDLSHFTNFWN